MFSIAKGDVDGDWFPSVGFPKFEALKLGDVLLVPLALGARILRLGFPAPDWVFGRVLLARDLRHSPAGSRALRSVRGRLAHICKRMQTTYTYALI